MNTINIGIICYDQACLDMTHEAFEEILLDEICNKTIYDKQGEDGIEEALVDWEEAKTDALIVIPAEDDAKLNPAGLNGLDMLVWEDLRMAFVSEGEDFGTQMELLCQTLKREFDIDNPRIIPHLDIQNYKTYDAVIVNDRAQGIRDFLEATHGRGVAYTCGRELVCTSPFSTDSFHESIYLAKDILRNRDRYDMARKNPLPKLFIDKKEDNRRK